MTIDFPVSQYVITTLTGSHSRVQNKLQKTVLLLNGNNVFINSNIVINIFNMSDCSDQNPR